MNLGYDKALYLLPYDHRQSYVTDMVHFEPPLDASQRDQVGCILLGCGTDEARVRSWLTVAAGVPGFIGFAVGRTSFWDAVAGYRAQTLTRVEAVAQIARRLREWVDVFEDGREEVREDGHDARVARADSSASVPLRPPG